MANAEPMGQQRYEQQIQQAIKAAAISGWEFDEVRITSARSAITGSRRIPMSAYNRAPLPLALVIGAAAYRTRHLVHRLDLRIPPAGRLEVVTVHDLPPLRFRDEGMLPRSAAQGARRARRVICPSQFAADEVQELLNVPASSITVIPNGVDRIFFEPELPTPSYTDGRPFVLHAAGATERKNLPMLATAWRIVNARHPDVQLVLAGPEDERRTRLFRDVPNARLIGRLKPREIAGLMRQASVVVVPSRYEGFGLPALEAMAAGTPVVAAATGALPEVCGTAAILVEPVADALAAGMERALIDSAEVDRLATAGPQRAREFTWDRAALAHLDVYRDALT